MIEKLSRPSGSRHATRAALFAVVAATIASHSAIAHPVPSDTHLRTIIVRIRPDEVAIRYRLELDQFTTVYKDSKGLIEDHEIKKLNTPSAFYGEFIRRLAPLLADQLDARLNGRPLQLKCVDQRFEVTDHLACEFIFQADWSLEPGRDYRLEFRDRTYDLEQGRVKLSVEEAESIDLVSRIVPGSLLQSLSPTDLKPGDDDKLRTVFVVFRLAGTDAAPSKAQALPPSVPPKATVAANSSLLALLDAPHGFGVLLLLAGLFGAAHALTPGHGKTLVAAYLVGERGTVWHAIALGLTTTITHTGAVLILAAGLLWWFPDAVPAQVQTILGFAGGMMIAGLGLWLLLKRLSGGPDHVHIAGVGHSHNADGSITFHQPDSAGWGRLILLGISGGIVPCWDAIAMLGFAIAAQRLWLGVPLLLAFSAGLAGVLVIIGIGVVYAQGRVGSRLGNSRIWRMLPVMSALFLLVMGLWLCRDSLSPPIAG